MTKMMKFLVCYDASPAAKRALDRTLELIRPLGDHIVRSLLSVPAVRRMHGLTIDG